MLKDKVNKLLSRLFKHFLRLRFMRDIEDNKMDLSRISMLEFSFNKYILTALFINDKDIYELYCDKINALIDRCQWYVQGSKYQLTYDEIYSELSETWSLEDEKKVDTDYAESLVLDYYENVPVYNLIYHPLQYVTYLQDILSIISKWSLDTEVHDIRRILNKYIEEIKCMQ